MPPVRARGDWLGELNNTIYLRTAMWADSCGVNFETAELDIKTKKWPDIVLPNRKKGAKKRKSTREDEDEARMVDCAVSVGGRAPPIFRVDGAVG